MRPIRTTSNLPAPVSYLEDGRPVYSGAAGRPNTQFRAINLVSSGASGNYHALDLSVRRRFDNGLQFSFNHGYSRARSNSDLTGGAVMDPSDLERDLGPNNLDQPHTVSTQWSFAPKLSSGALPEWPAVLRRAFYGSGTPFSPLAGADLEQRSRAERSPAGDRSQQRATAGLPPRPTCASRGASVSARRVRSTCSIESENLFNRLNATSVVTQDNQPGRGLRAPHHARTRHRTVCAQLGALQPLRGRPNASSRCSSFCSSSPRVHDSAQRLGRTLEHYTVNRAAVRRAVPDDGPAFLRAHGDWTIYHWRPSSYWRANDVPQAILEDRTRLPFPRSSDSRS